MSQLYITLSSIQDENKKEIKKINEKINETRQEINEKINETRQEINETQRDFNRRLDNIFSLIANRGGITIMIEAWYEGDLKKDEYHFHYSPYYDASRSGWFSMPYYGKIEQIVLKTPHNYKKHYRDLDHIAKSDDYTTIIRPFLQIQVRKDHGEILVVKTYMCNLFLC